MENTALTETEERPYLELIDLQEHIKRVLLLNYSQEIWLRAEIGQSNISGGHCYLTLVQQREKAIVAQAEAVVWQTTARSISAILGIKLSELMVSGREMLIKVEVSYHERFGLKLIVKGVDEKFLKGELQLEREATLKRLLDTGLMDLNRRLHLPRLTCRLAIFSSPTAAGYQDFVQQVLQNSYRYKFKMELFPIAVQGREVASTLGEQMSRLKGRWEDFDAIVVIRGGGSKMDLLAFDEWEVCRLLAMAPLPVIAGIGHETDESLVDKLANYSLKTPTAVAEFLIHRLLMLDMELVELGLAIDASVRRRVASFKELVVRAEMRLNAAVSRQVSTKKMELEQLQVYFNANHPQNILRKGYAYLEKADGTAANYGNLTHGDRVKIQFFDGDREGVVI